jgi:hypothetical protein
MTSEVIVYIAPPLTDRGKWRVRSDGRPVEEFGSEREAVAQAAKFARMVEHAGGTVVIKIERPDGTWETYRA